MKCLLVTIITDGVHSAGTATAGCERLLYRHLNPQTNE